MKSSLGICLFLSILLRVQCDLGRIRADVLPREGTADVQIEHLGKTIRDTVFDNFKLTPNVLPNVRLAKGSGDAVVYIVGDPQSGQSKVRGTITLHQLKSGALVLTGKVEGLPRSGKFGMHFHTNPVADGHCQGAGSHFNPYHQNHGGQRGHVRHLGDLGNINADTSGLARIGITDNKLTVLPGDLNSVVGRSLVVHLKADDLGTRSGNRESAKTGNSGPKIACGTVVFL
ncbi:Superoxide dismutase [Halotydeus destructor]|nr:Superoxide dismutase [Halotydeus destructor]